MSRRRCHLNFGSFANISGLQCASCVIPFSIICILFHAVFKISCSIRLSLLPIDQIQRTVICPLIGSIVAFSWSGSEESNPNVAALLLDLTKNSIILLLRMQTGKL